MARKGQPPKRFHTFGKGRGVYATDEMRRSVTWRSLTPAERLIALDMIRVYNGPSNGDSESIKERGFIFVYPKDLIELVSEDTFTKARERICEVGFFDKAHHLKELRPHAPNRYLPSERWRTYSPSAAERQRQQTKQRRGQQRFIEHKHRRANFLDGLSRATAEREGGKSGEVTQEFAGDLSKVRTRKNRVTSRVKKAVPGTENPGDHIYTIRLGHKCVGVESLNATVTRYPLCAHW